MNRREFQVIENYTYDGEFALYDVNDKVVIMSGDCYHDKIYDKISGFFDALEYIGYPFTREDVSIIPEDDIDLWDKCTFYDGRED